MQKEEQNRILSEWLTEHRALLFKIVRSYANTPHDQDDLFQEIALKLWDSLHKFRGDSAVTTWIYRVSFNAAITWFRKEQKRRDRNQSLSEVEPILKAISAGRNSRIDWLYEQIAQLDPIDRSIMLMTLEGCSHQEIAEAIGTTQSNIGVKVHRIKKSFTEKNVEE